MCDDVEEVPPGQVAKSMMPTASSGDNESKLSMAKPRMGKNTIWLIRPVIIPLGYLTTLRKSSKVSDKPMPNMISASTRIKIIELISTISGFLPHDRYLAT